LPEINKIMLKQILPLLISFLVLSTAGAQNNNTAAAFYKSGIEYKSKYMFLEAITALNKAITLDKKYDSAYTELADIYIKTNQIDLGVATFKKAIAMNPKNTTALFMLGKVYRDTKPNYDTAIIIFKSAIQIDSTNKEFFYSVAWCYNAKGDYDNAIIYAVKALDIDNTYRPAYGELGHAYNKSKKYAEGIKQFKKNQAVSVVDLQIYYSGMCYTALKDKEGALREYEELKKINEKMATSLKKTIDKME
jgi:tetratricopeptide (TPR) repeat protein